MAALASYVNFCFPLTVWPFSHWIGGVMQNAQFMRLRTRSVVSTLVACSALLLLSSSPAAASCDGTSEWGPTLSLAHGAPENSSLRVGVELPSFGYVLNNYRCDDCDFLFFKQLSRTCLCYSMAELDVHCIPLPWRRKIVFIFRNCFQRKLLPFPQAIIACLSVLCHG